MRSQEKPALKEEVVILYKKRPPAWFIKTLEKTYSVKIKEIPNVSPQVFYFTVSGSLEGVFNCVVDLKAGRFKEP